MINIGGTAVGIGVVYELAKQRGFRTLGIVSTLARDGGETLSPCVDLVFFVRDASWGGRLPGSKRLAPTSAAIVANSREHRRHRRRRDRARRNARRARRPASRCASSPPT